MKKIKRFVSYIVAGTITLSMISPTLAYTKEETVYTKLNADGSIKTTIVSEHLKNDENENELNDLSDLNDIYNVNGDESFQQDGQQIVWESDGHDIYYQGTTNSQLPITMNITYQLNGKTYQVEDMLGKEGKVKIHIEYVNHVKKNQLYVPFVVMSGMVLSTDKNSQVEITNGKVTSNGSRYTIIGIAAPGLSDDFNNDKLEELNELTITYYTTDFELKSLLSIATPSLLSEDDMDVFDKMDEGYSLVDQLYSSYQKIEEGSTSLSQGTQQFVLKYNQFNDGMQLLKKNSKQFITGINQISTGMIELDTGLNQINNGLSTLTKNSNQLREGTKELTDSILTTINQQLKEANITVTEKNYEQVLNQAIQTYQTQLNQLESLNDEQKTNIENYEVKLMTLKTTITQLQTALTTLDSVFTFKKGVNSYTQGVDEIANGMPKTVEGSNQLLEGSKQLLDGMNQLDNGINELSSNSTLINEAAKTINDGVTQLDKGIKEFDEKGLSKINQYLQTLKTDTKKAKQLIELANDYQTFTKTKEGIQANTKFIMIIDAMKKE